MIRCRQPCPMLENPEALKKWSKKVMLTVPIIRVLNPHVIYVTSANLMLRTDMKLLKNCGTNNN